MLYTYTTRGRSIVDSWSNVLVWFRFRDKTYVRVQHNEAIS
jgi:hypothetical protein